MKRFLVFFVLVASSVSARDIDLDAIYITGSRTTLYNQLINEKSAQYERAGSSVIADSVIFAHWLNGRNIVYIRELTGGNIVYRHDLDTGSARELCRINGIITYSRCASSGTFIVIKVLIINGGDIPTGIRLTLDTETGAVNRVPVANAFQDFTFGPEGDSIIYQAQGLMEEWPASGIRRQVCTAQDIQSVAQKGSPVMGIFSPNRKSLLVYSGSGGSYQARVTGIYNRTIPGVSSASEIEWLDNRRILFRRGYPGFFSVDIFDCADGSVRPLVAGSLHTNMMLSRTSGIIAMLLDGIICLFDINSSTLFLSGLEGEDVTASPDGNRFLSLYHKKLYCTHRSLLEKKQLEIRRGGTSILSLYRALLLRRDAWENDYSGDYLARKIKRYQEVTREGTVAR